jgi:hypothetical protein
MIGIPGTGLGGIFYGLLILWMSVRELALTLRRQSCGARWRRVGWFATLLGAIVVVFWLEAWLLKELILLWHGGPTSVTATNTPVLALGALVPALALAPLVILATLLLAMHGLNLALRWRASQPGDAGPPESTPEPTMTPDRAPLSPTARMGTETT